jgi:Protein of unknown function DUF262/Protein of unknown function (DUF1524)/Domain of unknown function (DUF4268)
MDAGTHSLRVIFGQDRRHVVPLYQRPYVWTEEEQWAPLWEDVRAIADRIVATGSARTHFLGAIVLDQVDVPYGQMETRVVIDGQQRLTTMQLLLEAFGDACEAVGLADHAKAAKKLTRNDDPLNHEEDQVFKIWPTNSDQPDFRKVMDAGSPAEVCAAYGVKAGSATVGHRIADAYLYFYKEIATWLGMEEGRGPRAKALLGTLQDALRMVVIGLKEGDDAQLIFETMNARGTPLLPSDLIKNFLFLQAAKTPDADLDKLYKKHWREFDERATYWRELLGRGHAQRARLDLFIQYFLTLKTADDVAVSHLYSAFKTYCQAKPKVTAEDHFTEIRRYAAVFRSFDEFEPASREGRFFKRLAAMDTSTAYPFLLDLFRIAQDRRDLVAACLDRVESFLVRRLVCQLNTRGYNRLFTEMLSVLPGDVDGLPGRLETFLASGTADSNRWPGDEEVVGALLTVPIYDRLQRSRVNMLLASLNDAMYDVKTEQLGPTSLALTIEHLMPQSWQEHWPIPAEKAQADAAAKRNQLVHTLGNLSLLNNRLNPALSNGPWLAKLPEILRHSALNLNRELPADWNEGAIERRGESLSKIACDLWSAPPAVRSAPTPTVAISMTTTGTGEGTKEPTFREQIFRRFWASLVERSKEKTDLLANRTTSPDHWFNAPSGRVGFILNLSLTEEFARVECYIRLKNAQDVENKAVFKSFLAQREAIEGRFGEALEWQELPGRLGCRICKTYPQGSWHLPESEWGPLQDQLIDALIRLEAAMHDPIRAVELDRILSRSPS